MALNLRAGWRDYPQMAKLLWSVSEFLLAVLGACIWVASTALAAASGFVAMVATTLLPGISQVYWIKSISAATGTAPEPLTTMCVIWLGLLVVRLYARHYALAGHRATEERARLDSALRLLRPLSDCRILPARSIASKGRAFG